MSLGWDSYYKLEKVTSAVSAPRDRATSAQTLVKGKLFHNEFGTRSGLPLRSRYCIHKGNAMRSTILKASKDAVIGERITVSSALIRL
jgi:hypothetical protein